MTGLIGHTTALLNLRPGPKQRLPARDKKTEIDVGASKAGQALPKRRLPAGSGRSTQKTAFGVEKPMFDALVKHLAIVYNIVITQTNHPGGVLGFDRSIEVLSAYRGRGILVKRLQT